MSARGWSVDGGYGDTGEEDEAWRAARSAVVFGLAQRFWRRNRHSCAVIRGSDLHRFGEFCAHRANARCCDFAFFN